jgi:hypothetical protein
VPIVSRPPVLIQPGGLTFTAPIVIPTITRTIRIQMTDLGDYYSGIIGFIRQWGWQISRDGGATWEWKTYQGNILDSTQWIAFGQYPGRAFWQITNITRQPNPTVTLASSTDLQNGEIVDISLVLGATQANGVWPVSQVNPIGTFRISIGSTPNPYQSGGIAKVRRLPYIVEDGVQLSVESGNQARLAIDVTAPITLGADIVTV